MDCSAMNKMRGPKPILLMSHGLPCSLISSSGTRYLMDSYLFDIVAVFNFAFAIKSQLGVWLDKWIVVDTPQPSYRPHLEKAYKHALDTRQISHQGGA